VETTHAILLGLLQGLGEFLPISSSAHLIVVPWFLGWREHTLAFDVALHFGTLLAVLYAFAPDWSRVISAAFRDVTRGQPFSSQDSRLLALLILASVPAGVGGLLLQAFVEGLFRAPALIATNMALMGALLLLGDRCVGSEHRTGGVTLAHALVIGCAQALALFPGVSRAGATITAALFLGYSREESARFSFLLATPAILGAAILKLPSLLASPSQLSAAGIGALCSAVVGFFSIRFLLRYVQAKDYRPFAYYRWVFALVVFVRLALR